MISKEILQLYYKIFRIPLSLLSGSCGTLAFSPYNCWPAAIFSLIGLSIVILNCNYRQSCYFSFFWGLGLFGTGVNWIYISIDQFSNISKLINIVLTTFLIIYLTFYPMLFSIILTQIWPSTTFSRLVFASPMLWSLTEFLRSYLFSGFPWLQFGYSQVNAPLKGLAPILGVEGITFVLMLISGLLTFVLIKKKLTLNFLIKIVLFFIFLWSLQLIHWYYAEPEKSTKITLVQGNIDKHLKYDSDYLSKIFNIYLKYTLKNINNRKIIVWPESAIPDDNIMKNDFFKKLHYILKKNHVTLITGIIEKKNTLNGLQYYNNIIVIGESIAYNYPVINRYTKYNLVPFGEVIPVRKILKPFLSFFNVQFECFTQGKYFQPQLIASKIQFTPSICYEIIFGNRIRNNFSPETDCLLTISNNVWFGNSIEPWQHLQMIQMRALELGRPLIHSTNNGVTAFIKANGMLQATLPQFVESELTCEMTPTKGLTPYARLGIYPIRIISVIFGILAIRYER